MGEKLPGWLWAALALVGLAILGEKLQGEDRRRGALGNSAFAMLSPDYPIEESLGIFRGLPVKSTAVLLGTFGSKWENVRRFLELPSERTILEIHFSNGPGRRNRRLGSGELNRKLGPAAYSRAWERLDPRVVKPYRRRIERAVSELLPVTGSDPRYTLLGVIELEGNGSLRAARNMVKIAREAWPYAIVWNPLKMPRRSHVNFVGADFIEVHDLPDFRKVRKLGPCIANLDGRQPLLGRAPRAGYFPGYLSAEGLDRWIREARAACDYVFLWDGEISNGIQFGAVRFVAPRDREFPHRAHSVRLIREALKASN